MLFSLQRYPKLSKLNVPFAAAHIELLAGEQYLIQTIDKRIALTTHRLILNKALWLNANNSSIKLEDIQGWEVKATRKTVYFGLSLFMAFLVYFNDAFALISGFFLVLYFTNSQHRVHIKSQNKTMILPLEVKGRSVNTLIDMVRKAKHNRNSQLEHEALV